MKRYIIKTQKSKVEVLDIIRNNLSINFSDKREKNFYGEIKDDRFKLIMILGKNRKVDLYIPFIIGETEEIGNETRVKLSVRYSLAQLVLFIFCYIIMAWGCISFVIEPSLTNDPIWVAYALSTFFLILIIISLFTLRFCYKKVSDEGIERLRKLIIDKL